MKKVSLMTALLIASIGSATAGTPPNAVPAAALDDSTTTPIATVTAPMPDAKQQIQAAAPTPPAPKVATAPEMQVAAPTPPVPKIAAAPKAPDLQAARRGFHPFGNTESPAGEQTLPQAQKTDDGSGQGSLANDIAPVAPTLAVSGKS